jgi:hypothetical protein
MVTGEGTRKSMDGDKKGTSRAKRQYSNPSPTHLPLIKRTKEKGILHQNIHLYKQI